MEEKHCIKEKYCMVSKGQQEILQGLKRPRRNIRWYRMVKEKYFSEDTFIWQRMVEDKFCIEEKYFRLLKGQGKTLH